MVPDTADAKQPTNERRPAADAHTSRIANAGHIAESERLARRWFSTLEERAFDRLGDLVHDDVVIISKMQQGLVLEGKEAVLRYMHETLSDSLYEASTTMFLPIDDVRIVVEGRIRWIDEERVIRDDAVNWAMEFRESLLARLVPARTLVEAETILGGVPT